VPERTVTAGERVCGKLEIRPREDVNAQGVALVSVDGGWRRCLAKSEIAGVVSLQAMQSLELSFEVEVPDIAAPTPEGLLPSAYKGPPRRWSRRPSRRSATTPTDSSRPRSTGPKRATTAACSN
jgi:hypothetical protein